LVAAGSVVLEGTVVEANSVYAGIPAKKVKALGPENKAMMERIAANYVKYSGWYTDK
jgi:carbonic anhydrase/acetyltransferase-like protein (isoleucine patch superfamily)